MAYIYINYDHDSLSKGESLMDAADQVRWTLDLARFEHRHLICCSPESGSCNLRTVEVERRRSGNPEWAGFQLASHARADVLNAQAELWPATRGADWERLTDEQVRSLPFLTQALWTLIIRGPFPEGERRVPLPANQATKSRFGMVTWRAAELVLRRHHHVIQANQSEALGMLLTALNGPEERQAPRYVPDIVCRPGIHEWGIGGTPHPDALCRCGRVRYDERAG